MYKADKPVIMVLGGYGGVGSLIVSLLIQNTDSNIIIAGRTIGKAEKLLTELIGKFHCADRLSVRMCDISHSKREDFSLVDLVVHATTSNKEVVNLARVVIEAGADLIDLGMKHILTEIESDVREKKRTVIAQAGFHPGLPSAFTRHLRPMFDRYDVARISMAMRAEFNSPESVNELIYLVGDWQARVCDDGEWRTANFQDVITTDFGEPFGVQQCFPLEMIEMELVSRQLEIKQAGVYVIGFNRLVDSFIFPLIMLAYKIKYGLLDSLWRRLLFWGINRFGKGEQGVVFILDAVGVTNGKDKHIQMTARSADPYWFTAVPVFSCIRQYLDGSIRHSGLSMMGQVVNTDKLLQDMTDFGIEVEIKEV